MPTPRPRKSPDGSTVIGTTKLGEMYDRSWTWARALLLEWEKEQLAGGPVRVFRKGKKGALHTTIAVLQRDMPPARDQALVRKVKEHDRDLDALSRRIDDLTTQLHLLRRQIEPKSGLRISG